jgi:hypothetical protein
MKRITMKNAITQAAIVVACCAANASWAQTGAASSGIGNDSQGTPVDAGPKTAPAPKHKTSKPKHHMSTSMSTSSSSSSMH